MQTAKLFWNGSSQAVRLPKEFRFEGSEVRIRRQGRQVIIEPVEDSWDWLEELGEADTEFTEEVKRLHTEADADRDWSVFE